MADAQSLAMTQNMKVKSRVTPLHFYFQRRRLFHTLTLIVPNVLLATLVSLVFLLPENGGEKLAFSMSLLLAFALNLSVLVSAMPRSSLEVSHLIVYLTALRFV